MNFISENPRLDQQQQEELSEQAAEVVKEKVPAKKREKGTGRMILPESLRREIIIIEPTENARQGIICPI